jgi:hypothetical protein
MAKLDIPPRGQRRRCDPRLELLDGRLSFLVQGVRLADGLVNLCSRLAGAPT